MLPHKLDRPVTDLTNGGVAVDDDLRQLPIWQERWRSDIGHGQHDSHQVIDKRRSIDRTEFLLGSLPEMSVNHLLGGVAGDLELLAVVDLGVQRSTCIVLPTFLSCQWCLFQPTVFCGIRHSRIAWRCVLRWIMLEQILNEHQRALVRDERRLLAEVHDCLSRCEASEEDRRTLVDSVEQIDDLFLLVVVGEFNAGKSALINALIGSRILSEGVTPTTSEIYLVQHGDEHRQEQVGSGLVSIRAPVELLRHLTLVDTPGTNALERRHEAITAEFVPRSDLVLFVTSADRPFSESERVFLAKLRQWGKKILVVLNKVDILQDAIAIDEVQTYIGDRFRELLGFEPQIFGVSARAALEALHSGNADALVESGLPAVTNSLRSTLDDAERLRLKLLNPLGVARNLVGSNLSRVKARLELLREDVETIATIERQLEHYGADVEREFGLRLADVDNTLHCLEKRGLEFFDDSLRLLRLPELFNKEKVRTDFEHKVVVDAPQEIEAKVDAMIDWLVDSDINQWQAVVQHVSARQSRHAERIVGEVGGRFDVDRARLLDTVGRAARDGLRHYDRAEEARRMAESARNAVAGTALMEAGAVGLGATVVLLASGTAADVTGLVAAGLLATLGLFVLPARRRRAKRELRETIGELRDKILLPLGDQFRREAARSQSRIQETIAPYTRFIHSERDHLSQQGDELEALRQRIDQLRGRVEGNC